ncbi:MAG TPA: ribonuclease P protein component [Patescibacteria group bacterium]|nr:ribonuclease P protein component [Patescibacteria group bacterium]
MLQQDNRLAKVRDFNLLMKYGRWANGVILDLKYLELAKIKNYFPKKEDPDKFARQLKIAFTVGLKISKSAVKRNRAKRQMREAVRLLVKDPGLKTGFYLMFVAKKGILEKDYAEISKEMTLLLQKTKIFS